MLDCPICGTAHVEVPEFIVLEGFLYFRGIPLDLSLTETRIVNLLYRRLGRVIGYDVFFDFLWGHMSSGGPINPKNNLRTMFAKIRHKLKDSAVPLRIANLSGSGYFMVIVT